MDCTCWSGNGAPVARVAPLIGNGVEAFSGRLELNDQSHTASNVVLVVDSKIDKHFH